MKKILKMIKLTIHMKKNFNNKNNNINKNMN